MNYRQLSTKIWKDEKFVALDDSCQKLVLYLITNSSIGLIPAYKLSEREVLFDLCWTKDKYQKCLSKLSSVGIYLVDEFVILDNQYANYFITGGKTDKERDRQTNSLPENIKKWVLSEITIGQLLGNNRPTIETITYPIPISISKTNKDILASKAYLERWNSVFGTKYSSSGVIDKPLEFWLKSYTLDQILEAIPNIKKDSYWKDKDVDPIWLLRTKDTKGEPVDRIGRMLNLQKPLQVKGSPILDMLKKAGRNDIDFGNY